MADAVDTDGAMVLGNGWMRVCNRGVVDGSPRQWNPDKGVSRGARFVSRLTSRGWRAVIECRQAFAS